MGSDHWTRFHSIFGIILLICLISVFKNPYVFFEDYSKALYLTPFQYSIILLSLYAGNITSLFFGVYVNNTFRDKYQRIASVLSLISGVLTLLYCLIVYINSNANVADQNQTAVYVVVYGSVIAFLFKNSSCICYATVVGLANEWSESHIKGANISYLQMSWSVSTLLYIPIGFILEYGYWWIPFQIFGCFLILFAFIINWGFTFEPHHSQQHVQSVSVTESSLSSLSQEFSNIGDLKYAFNKHSNLILLSIFFGSISYGSFLIVTTSLWLEDVYHLESSMVGLVTISIFAAEVGGSLIMACISDSYGIFVCSFVAFVIEIIASLIIVNLSIFYGAMIGGLWICIILSFFLFVGWEIFFITQVLAMIEFGPPKLSTNIVLLLLLSVSSIAKMIGTEFSSLLWENGNGLTLLSSIWLVTNILGLGCYLMLYQIKDKEISDESDYEELA